MLLKLGKITSMTFPLYVAIIKKTSDCNKIVKLLIDAGADVNARDEHKFLPLGYAIAIGKICFFYFNHFRMH